MITKNNKKTKLQHFVKPQIVVSKSQLIFVSKPD